MATGIVWGNDFPEQILETAVEVQLKQEEQTDNAGKRTGWKMWFESKTDSSKKIIFPLLVQPTEQKFGSWVSWMSNFVIAYGEEGP